MTRQAKWRPAKIPVLTRRVRPSDQSASWDIESISFSREGRQLAVLTDGPATRVALGEIAIWDMESGDVVAKLEGQGNVAYSPDGTLLATGLGKQACLYDARTLQRIYEFPTQGYCVNYVAFSPSGEVLAVADFGKFVLWNVRKRRLIKEIQAHDLSVKSLVFTPDGSKVASRSPCDMAIWNIATGDALSRIHALEGPKCHGCFTPSGKLLISGRDKESLAAWTIKGARRGIFSDPSAKGYFLCTCLSPDATIVATGGQDRTVHFWDARTRSLLTSLRGSNTWTSSVAFSPDGKILAAGGGTRVHLWEQGGPQGSPADLLPLQPESVDRKRRQKGLRAKNADDFVARLRKIKWFANVGKPSPRDDNVHRIHDWDEWPGPEDRDCYERSRRYQAHYEDLFVAIRTYALKDVEKLWDRVIEEFKGMEASLPFTIDGDCYDPTSQCVTEAKVCAALIACYLKMNWRVPDEIVDDWQWFESGHWPTGKAVL